jgi:PAS domain S-box-containing protein
MTEPTLSPREVDPAEMDAMRREVAQLRASEASFRVLLDESSDPIFSFEPDGTYRYVNQAFANGVHKAREQIIGHRIWDVFEPAEAEKRYAVLKEVFATGQPKVFEVRVPRPDGDRFYLTTVQPVLSATGAVRSAMCSSKDITERRRMEAQLKERLVELEGALAHVRRLQGIIPICAHCHSVRRDPETWQRLESYVAENSDAKFSHGICPTCLERHYASLGTPP